jgi:hypothetical protein
LDGVGLIRLFVNTYTDPDANRADELGRCLAINKSVFDSVVELSGRPPFSEIFAGVNEIVTADDISVIANSDIYFDRSVRLAEKMKPDEAYALTRWDDTLAGITFFNRIDSQDVWIFRGVIREMQVDFPPGKCGCDNRLAAEMAMAGYRVSNPSHSIKTMHLHRTGLRRYAPTDAVAKPYALIVPSVIGQAFPIRFVK